MTHGSKTIVNEHLKEQCFINVKEPPTFPQKERFLLV